MTSAPTENTFWNGCTVTKLTNTCELSRVKQVGTTWYEKLRIA